MKRVVVCAAALALGVTGAGYAQASEYYKVTGGGQTFPFEAEVSGPGDTIAFNAQQTAEPSDDAAPAEGQVQYLDREGPGKPVANIHGTVDCLRVEGDRAIIEGTITRGGDEDFFRIDLMDTGRENRGTDWVFFQEIDSEPECEEVEDQFDDQPVLARGNVTIHEPGGAEE